MKILHVIPDGSAGGGASHVTDLVDGLRGEHQMEVVTQPGSFLAESLRRRGTAVHEVDMMRRRLSRQVTAAVARLVEAVGPDICHVHGTRAAVQCAGLTAGPRTQWLATVHGWHGQRKPFPLRLLQEAVECRALGRFARVILVSEADRRRLPAHLAPRSLVIPHGVDPALFPFLPRVSGGQVAGFVGRMDYSKNPELFVEMMARLPREWCGVMAGEGVLSARVRDLIRQRDLGDRIRWCGRVDRKDLGGVYGRMDVLVVPSRWEAFGLVAVEGMLSGVPVVASAVGGLAEVLSDGRTGLLVRPDDPGAFARAVQKVERDSVRREGLIREARQEAVSRFSVEVMLKRTNEVYRTLEQAAGKPQEG